MGTGSSLVMRAGGGRGEGGGVRRGEQYSKEELAQRLSSGYVLGQLMGHVTPHERYAPQRTVGRAVVMATIQGSPEEDTWTVSVSVLALHLDKSGGRLIKPIMVGGAKPRVWLDHEATEIAPVETTTNERGKSRYPMVYVFRLARGELSAYSLSVAALRSHLVGRNEVVGRGRIPLHTVLDSTHPLWLHLYRGKAPPTQPHPLSEEARATVEQELREAAIAHSVAGCPAPLLTPHYGNKRLLLHCRKLGQTTELYVHHGVPGECVDN